MTIKWHGVGYSDMDMYLKDLERGRGWDHIGYTWDDEKKVFEVKYLTSAECIATLTVKPPAVRDVSGPWGEVMDLKMECPR